jgi:uracil-DNA glycosylase
VVVALGATAAKALLGPAFKVTTQRGEVVTWPDGRMVTPRSIRRRSCGWTTTSAPPPSPISSTTSAPWRNSCPADFDRAMYEVLLTSPLACRHPRMQ